MFNDMANTFPSIMKMKKVALCGMALLFFISTGCTNRSHFVSPSVRWRAPHSTLEADLAAATELVPLGTTASAARNLLGMDGYLAHYHGPTVTGSGIKGNLSFRRVADHDDWALVYEVAGGKIRLMLEWPPGNTNLENAVVKSIRCMKRFPLTVTSHGQGG